jgi:hypothetical protein
MLTGTAGGKAGTKKKKTIYRKNWLKFCRNSRINTRPRPRGFLPACWENSDGGTEENKKIRNSVTSVSLFPALFSKNKLSVILST